MNAYKIKFECVPAETKGECVVVATNKAAAVQKFNDEHWMCVIRGMFPMGRAK